MSEADKIEEITLGIMTKSNVAPIINKSLGDYKNKIISYQDKVTGYTIKICIRVETPEIKVDEFGVKWKRIP